MEALLLLALILMNGGFAMAETSIVAARRHRLERRAREHDALARSALAVAEHPTRSLSTIQIGITSIGILSGIVGEAALARPLADWAIRLGAPAAWSYPIATTLVVVIVTYLSIVFGEIVPKRLAQMNPEGILRVASNPLLALGVATSPFVRLLTGSTELLLRLLGAHRRSAPAVTEEEIDSVLVEGSKAGLIEDEERQMVQNVFRLDQRPLSSLMVPRSDIVALDVEDPPEVTLRRIAESDHARFPLVHGGLDEVLGYVTARRVLLRAMRGDPPDLRSHLEPAAFVPETLNGFDLLVQFRRTGTPMAFVVDEYGAVQGLVTVHDLIEAIAGEFQEPETADSWAIRRADGSWLLDGALAVADLKERLALRSLPAEQGGLFHTLGGMLMYLFRRVPRPGDYVEWEHWRFEIMDMDGRRIDKVLASLQPQPPPPVPSPAAPDGATSHSAT